MRGLAAVSASSSAPEFRACSIAPWVLRSAGANASKAESSVCQAPRLTTAGTSGRLALSGPGQPAWLAHEHQTRNDLIANLARARRIALT